MSPFQQELVVPGPFCQCSKGDHLQSFKDITFQKISSRLLRDVTLKKNQLPKNLIDDSIVNLRLIGYSQLKYKK